jgi:YYY domain-containing protein
MGETVPPGAKKKSGILLLDLLLVLVLLAGAYFRWVGLDWGEYQFLHPDERFLIWVGSDITPVKCQDPTYSLYDCPPDQKTWMSLSEYFNTATSTLNPNNRGHGFYVYGTLPMFLTRLAVEWVYGHSGFNEMTNVGRALSALADLLTVFLVYLIARRLYDRRVGLLAAAFAAGAVLMIQQSHFFTMDTFLNFFIYLAIYFAVRIAGLDWEAVQLQSDESGVDPEAGDILTSVADGAVALVSPARTARSQFWEQLLAFIRHPLFLLSVGFGFALGCAVASKLNAAPVALVLPAAFALQWLKLPSHQRQQRLGEMIGYLVLAAVVSLLVFRLFQPYAFSGPGFLGLKPNEQWVNNIREQRNQAAGDVDFPPALQWARQPMWFSGQNLVLWGLGIPLGVLAWAGFLWAGWRMLADKSPGRPELHRHVLLWGWTGFYFIWQSLQFNPTMRYQLPIYPALAIFAAWAVFALYDRGREKSGSRLGWRQLLAAIITLVVLLGTYTWAYAFSGIYARPITRVEASRWIYQNIPGPVNLRIEYEQGIYNQPVPYASGQTISPEQPFATDFTARKSGLLKEVYLPHALDIQGDPGLKVLNLKVDSLVDPQLTASSTIQDTFLGTDDPRGDSYSLILDPPLSVEEGQTYRLNLALSEGNGTIALTGAAPANEGDWDDGLPLRLDGFDGYGGIYQPGLNFNMYTDDNPDKLARFIGILEQADFILISSNRQWGSLPRLPERFPMTSTYYRDLLGCPEDKSIQWCYTVAEPGMFQGNLGFDLVQVFQSDPSIGSLRINDQSAEEAFTVYDHPKVLIFKKNKAFDIAQVNEILGAVDFSKVVHITPKRAGSNPANLLLPTERWQGQQAGGSWSDIFDTQALFNRYPVLGALLWYLALSLVGWAVYPLLRAALPGLPDKGYPLARIAGILLLAYLVWLAGSAGIAISRLTISVVFVVIALSSLLVAIRQRGDLLGELRQRRGYFLSVEALFLLLFIVDLLIRVGNPDLWHPWKGGEKPMDFAYFNAILKSTTFPPYDPWYAGGYLNYYYYGFVLMGVLTRWLGIVPAVAYNLIIPTLFALIAMGAFSLAWNLSAALSNHSGRLAKLSRPFWVGFAGAVGMAVLGNLGTLRMIYQGYQRVAAPGGVTDGASVLTRLVWAVQGFVKALGGGSLPYSLGDWYWIPSRAIPAPGDVEPITEFPFFTVLYADLHAHLFALPVTLLALAFALAVILGRGRWKSVWGMVAGFLLGGLAIGALKPTNTWDFYTYLAIGSVSIGYAFWSYYPTSESAKKSSLPVFKDLPLASQRLLVAAAGILALVGLSILLYQPFANWYALGYNQIELWKGTHTPLSAYLVHWGLFLFVIVSWMTWETRDWLASTPLSSLRKLEPYKLLIQFALVGLLALVVIFLVLKAGIAWFVLPLAAWAGVLLLRPNLPDAKRFVLFLVGTGLVLTLMVEVIVLRGDIGRMNTVFKFYLQVWTMFSVSAAAALGWVFPAVSTWRPAWRAAWQVSMVVLLASASLYPLLASMAKIEDRMSARAPHTLDGMAFMQDATYLDEWGEMDLSQDYRAIRWMQENVVGSPVIVEANLRNLYRWGSRYSIYTGLPGVVGWEWHQQQQRAILPGNWVSDRIAEVDNFYLTTDLQQALEFLRKYNVRYIILGQQERGLYSTPRLLDERGYSSADGLNKFEMAEGMLWDEVYRDGDTVIYYVPEQVGSG